jgi:hypothetical protein
MDGGGAGRGVGLQKRENVPDAGDWGRFFRDRSGAGPTPRGRWSNASLLGLPPAHAATARVTRDDAGPHGDLAIKLPYSCCVSLSPLLSLVQ